MASHHEIKKSLSYIIIMITNKRILVVLYKGISPYITTDTDVDYTVN